jgi:hypothetical protein
MKTAPTVRMAIVFGRWRVLSSALARPATEATATMNAAVSNQATRAGVDSQRSQWLIPVDVSG